MGICYEFGYGLAKDVEIALKLYREAAEKGHVQAMYNLGCLLFKQALSNTYPGERRLPSIKEHSQFKDSAMWFRLCLLKI